MILGEARVDCKAIPYGCPDTSIKNSRDMSSSSRDEGTLQSNSGVATPVTIPAAGTARVEIRGLSKTFPGTRALHDIQLDIRVGEIHALVGGNGSGKSTLIKILTGVYQGDDGGTITIDGHTIEPSQATPEQAKQLGVYAVHQDLGVFADMSVAENIALGYGYSTDVTKRVRWREQRARTRRLLERFEIDAAPQTPLSALSQSARTLVAIARALQTQEEGTNGLLILDEPTASLPAHEVELLLSTLRRYAQQGQAILYVTHRLDEVMGSTDRVTVLRDGSLVGTFDVSSLTESELIGHIVGRQIDRVFPPMPAVTDTTPIVEVRGLTAGPLKDVSFQVRSGEVLGIGGLLGSGRTELLRALFGDLPLEGGEIILDGKPLRLRSAADAMAAGIAYVPENRAVDAAFPDLTVAANISMANLRQYWSRGLFSSKRMRRDARGLMGSFLVKAAAEDALLSTLSGGNQQKVIIARWLRRHPRLLLLDEPTQGIDVGARAEIYSLVRDAVAAGAAAIIVASDFEELAHVCDRVLMLRAGRHIGEVLPPDLTADSLTRAANERMAA